MYGRRTPCTFVPAGLITGKITNTRNMMTRRTVLVAPLDWGLGHAARSVPLVRALQKLGYQVLLASAGDALALLRAECPDVPAYEMPDYGIRYPTGNMAWNMLRQAPKLAVAVAREHFWLRRFVREHPVDLILSDSRFGCFHPAVPSILLTHQLEPLVPTPVIGPIIQALYRAALHRFREIWIPDFPPPEDLAGRLAEAGAYRIPVRHIGRLSRFTPGDFPITAPVTDLLVLLSGPEPQRTQLEQQLWPQLQGAGLRIHVVRGLPNHTAADLVPDGLITVDRVLHGPALQAAIAATRVVLCRSGYSTLMDLAVLRKPAILVPTPGQTEQLYLAERVRIRGWGVVQPQESLNFDEAWRQVQALRPVFPPSPDGFSLEEELRRVLAGKER